MLRMCGFALAGLGAACFGMSWALATEPGRAAEILAAHIRLQGYRCDGPRSAKRISNPSLADAKDWLVDCGNAHYRFRLIPDRVEVQLVD